LRFECQPGCVACCRQRGFVYLTAADLIRAAEFVGLGAAAFERKYVYRTRHKLRLRVPRGSTCHFLNGEGCSIHPAKPAQCRIFPFWPELVDDRREWLKTARYCPGMSQGPLIRIRSAREQAEEMRREHPAMYLAYRLKRTGR
jgi:Fe-S-cluster containining protein